MRLTNFLVLLFISFSCVSFLTDCFSMEDDDYSFDPKRQQVLKNIPMIIKRSYKRWNLINTCNDRFLRSTKANVKPMESEWLTFVTRMPRLVTRLLKSQILLEFHKVEDISLVGEYNYSMNVRPFKNKDKSRHLRIKKLVNENDLVEMYFNITSIHYKLMSSGHKYMRLRYRLFVTDGNSTQLANKMPFNYTKMKAYLITLEENKNCTLDFMKMHAQKLLDLSKRQSMLKTIEKLPLYPSIENPYYTCRLTNWHVPFSQIGWGSFVVAPSVINAKACTGTCDFPLITNTTQHALLQAAVSNTAGIKTSVCCVPLTTEKTTLIIYDDHLDNVFIIKSENLIATSCGCR